MHGKVKLNQNLPVKHLEDPGGSIQPSMEVRKNLKVFDICTLSITRAECIRSSNYQYRNLLSIQLLQ